jgi:NAD(P)H-hydrate epimerase
MALISRQITKQLYHPASHSRKGDNGRLLIIGGSPKYHGSLVLCATMAAKVVDLVYVHTTRDNFNLIKKMRERLAEFIYINEKDLGHTIAEVDAILIGPGLEPNPHSRKLVNNILKNHPDKKIVIDAGALRVVNLKLLHKNCVLTPHAGEFKAIFGFAPTPANARLISTKYPAVIVLKGQIDYIGQNVKVWENHTGDVGMTKGGTGDVLAGLLAALLTKNAPLLATSAALYLSGRAGEQLAKKVGRYYSASEVIGVVQRIL